MFAQKKEKNVFIVLHFCILKNLWTPATRRRHLSFLFVGTSRLTQRR